MTANGDAKSEFYAQLSPEVALSARADADGINDNTQNIILRSIDTGRRLSRQRDALRGQFATWVNLEFRFGRAHVYRLIDLFNVFGDDGQIEDYDISATGLMLLASPNVDSSTRDKILDMAAQKRVTVDDVERALASAQERRDLALRGALAESLDIVKRIVAQYEVDDPRTINYMNEWVKNGNQTILEVAASGYIQPGEEHESVKISDDYSKIRAAMAVKQSIHRQAGLDERTEHMVYFEAKCVVSADGILHCTPVRASDLKDLDGKAVRFTGRVMIDA